MISSKVFLRQIHLTTAIHAEVGKVINDSYLSSLRQIGPSGKCNGYYYASFANDRCFKNAERLPKDEWFKPSRNLKNYYFACGLRVSILTTRNPHSNQSNRFDVIIGPKSGGKPPETRRQPTIRSSGEKNTSIPDLSLMQPVEVVQ